MRAFGGLRYAAIPNERMFGFGLIRHYQYMTANPLCRIPKPPQMRGFAFGLWTSASCRTALFDENIAKFALSFSVPVDFTIVKSTAASVPFRSPARTVPRCRNPEESPAATAQAELLFKRLRLVN